MRGRSRFFAPFAPLCGHPILLLFVAALLSTGCSIFEAKPDPSRFYVLRSAAPAPAPAALPSATAPVLRIGPGRVATYLESTVLLTSDGDNRLVPLPFHHWAEPLEQGIARVLGEELRRRLPTVSVVAAHDPSAPAATAQLIYEVTRFEGAPGRDVVLDTTWTLQRGNQKQVRPPQRFTIAATSANEGVEAYVARLSQAVAQWSDAVGAAFQRP
jgi:uncharacterized lipoprotein YmbA